MSIVLDGTKIAGEIRGSVRDEAKLLKQKTGIVPGLAVVLVGDDPASEIYVGRKAKACEEAGFASRQYRLAAATGEGELLNLIDALNKDSLIHGILVQLPLPSQISTQKVIAAIDPLKDVDGFHPYNVGGLVSGSPLFVPCTPRGIMELISCTGIELAGKEAVVVGRSNIVGKPMALLLLERHATVTICHSRTRDLPQVTSRADVLIAAVGKPHMITGDMVKKGAVVIDVGVNRLASGKLAGDVAFDEVFPKTSYITPVPGGVGPMTIAMLMRNTLDAAIRLGK
ncbi:MAG TPA: bifunctional methylenetetrahydrofolate dehydrogenase/methenyltetrahydrofolate cyclohydrolase FolD [Smithellaceae bacterium]|jgi:methylenetetrahydrofolate dehydrogenase (NADP+)/methenyltetrahydrofolate cyclohydrolase|nr:bifunctional methylenetetrahydrofolate dehydrogenase/methenyltetrahydrofolate cyclohydrolase FolD [Smithellaceae bacterium]HPV48460.1 bifunctional methylenetetrahydrofolate dehydrogenase/methenyltetrahydrofolate cyclohydrolase FolD [Smithellaceae bacterium]HQF84295.1 bifunctional methylenetetrahydrofolate dehydrogenase/methenyltetrahydrofolate cyclohydrolase FolD [Smithellaceae bacterium]HQG80805.1 bifunctional methylenetetrahydrofolate dehydrogenase/methenyltetrahydrofolate cyclohydrolase Fo